MGAARDAGKRGDYSLILPWLMAVVDPNEKWWKKLRRNPKRLGEVSQAAFLFKARSLGFKVALPWGDSERYDFVVWAEAAGKSARATIASVSPAMLRVQVKGTGRLHRRGYEVQAVHTTRGQGKKRYTKKEIDVLVAHVQPLDVWYVLPIAAIGRTKSLRFYPDIKSRGPRWEKYREAWEVLEDRG
jgi:PD-(D/E)XK endonuclease